MYLKAETRNNTTDSYIGIEITQAETRNRENNANSGSKFLGIIQQETTLVECSLVYQLPCLLHTLVLKSKHCVNQKA
jgi:hypothetical protein